MFSVRLVSADSYQAQPVPQLDPTFSEFRGSVIKHVPVIRIFGTTPDGAKTCLHVHGVFPYLFVPYTGEEDPEILAYRLAVALDAAINVSLGSATSNTQHIYSVQRVSGIPFYGYHRKEHQFLKVYFYNPAMIKRAADLLQNGSVLNQSLQPHEAHINYILQFMMDYNIYGMSLVNLRSCKHRRVAQSFAQLSSSGQSINSESSDIVYLPMEIERQSTCELEVDAVASDILNRLDIENDLELNPGLAAIWEEERARRAQAGLSGGDSQLVNPKSPTRPPFEPTDSDVYQEQRLARRLLMISQCDESTLSTTSHRSVAYAAEARDDDNLMNASRLPNVSLQRTERLHQGGEDESLGNMSFADSQINPASQNFTPDSSILGTEDMPLVDLLAQLARETETNQETVDADSLLGSQVSSVLLNENENKSDNDDEEEDEDATDLNLTCLELDSLGSMEAAVNRDGKSSLTGNTTSESKKKASIVLDASPFLSTCEISSCSAKSSRDEEIGENEDARSARVPQYDGAGDVSPTLLNSDHEETREIPNNAKDYERLPESNDFADMRSSMEIGILLSSGDDNEKAESLGESTQDEDGDNDDDDDGNNNTINDDDDDDDGDTLPLEAVLNGDPCFTESAELDKSDLTELRDQYVSLLDNALLPEIRDSSRIDSDDLEDSSPTFAVARFETIGKSCPVSPDITSARVALITSRGSSSSLENIAPNVPRASSIGSDDDDDPRVRKGMIVATSNDTADYNCNVVATWEELQNLRIIDKSENDRPMNSSRRRPRGGRYVPGPRSKRRWRRSSSFDRATGQTVHESAEKIEQATAQFCPPSESFRGSIDDSADKSRVDATRTGEIFDGYDETLSRVFDVTSSPQSLNEDTGLANYPAVRRRHGLDAFHRSIIDTDNPLADARSILPGARYSTYSSLDANDSLVEPILADFAETSDDLREDPTETLSDVGAESLSFASYYVPRRSLSHSAVEDRQHRHCFISKHNKIVQDHVFASDQLWIIQRRKRGSIPSNFRNLCTSEDCKLPIVFVRKLEKPEEAPVVEEKPVAHVDDSSPRQEECTVGATADPPPRIIPTSEKTDASSQPARMGKTRTKRKVLTTTSEATIAPSEKIDAPNDDAAATLSRELLSAETSGGGCAHRGAVRTKRDPCNTRRRLRGPEFAKEPRRNDRIDVESGEKGRNGRKKGRVRTKYKVGTLPGIPGIANDEMPDKRWGRPSSFKVWSSSSAREDETRYEPNGVAERSRANGLVPSSLHIDVPPEKLRGQRIKAASKAVPKGRPSSRHAEKDSSRLAELTGTTEKFADTRQRGTKIHSNSVLTSQQKLPETVTLGLMLQETRSPGTRRALQLLLQKRLNQKLECEKIKNERAVQKSSDEKTSGTKVADERVVASEETIVQRASEVTADGAEVTEAPKIRQDDEPEVSLNSEAPSFETVVTDSDANSQNPGDSISIVSLNSEICDPVEFDADATSLGAEFSVDDAAIVIFDGDNSVVVETTSSEEFTNVVKITYDTELYENTMKEANFFAGKNYSIDAVSNEIPTCLFEEDSNSVDKRLPKRTNEVDAESADDPDALSELSVDPRDMDVYDVESLTSTGSVSALDEPTDLIETTLDMSDGDSFVTEDAGIASLRENSRDQEASTNVDTFEDAIPERESSFEEDSPSFEALSPQPRVILILASSLEEEFAVHTALESTESQSEPERIALVKVHDETLGRSDNFSVTINEEESSINTDVSNNNAASENRPGTANEESSPTIESSGIATFSNFSIGADTCGDAIQSDQIDEKDPKVISENELSVSLVYAELENELEISEVVEIRGRTESPIDADVQRRSNVSMDDALEEEALSSAEKENSVLISRPREMAATEPSAELAEASADGTREENYSPPDAEEFVELSATTEDELNRIFVENERQSASISRDLPEAPPKEKNAFPTSVERQFDETTPVEREKQLPEITEEEAEVPVSVEDENENLTHARSPMTAHEDAEFPEPSAIELELLASREVDEQSVSAMGEESPSRTTVDDEQCDVSACTVTDVEPPAFFRRDEELQESNENHSPEPASLENEDPFSGVLEQPCLSVSAETDEQLLESAPIVASTIDEDGGLPKGSDGQSSSFHARVDSKDSPVRTENPSDTPIFQQSENHLSSNDFVETSRRIETDDELSKSVECDGTREEEADLSPSVEERSDTRAPVVEENEFSPKARIRDESPTVVRESEAKSDVSENESDESRREPEEQSSPVPSVGANDEEKTASPVSNETDEKLGAPVASSTTLSTIDNDACSQVAAKGVTEEEEAEKVAQQFAKEEETLAEEAERVHQEFTDGEVTIAEEAEEVAQRFAAEEETMEKEGEISGIEEPPVSLQRIETEEAQSRARNEETRKKNLASETKVVSGDEEILDSSKNVSMDINENDADHLPKADHASNEPRYTNASPKTMSPGDEHRGCEDEPKVRLECRPISIKLINIDLSKIRSFASKTCHQSDNPDGKSSQAMPKYPNEESDETIATETSRIFPKNCDDRASIVQTIGPMVENLEKSSTTESQISPCNEKVRRRRRRITKHTRIPERRSVRICTEVTLKSSQRQVPKNSMKSTVECSRREPGSDASMLVSSVSESSLSRNSAQILEDDGSTSGDVRKIDNRSKVVSPSSASKDDVTAKINEDPAATEVGAPPVQEFTVCQSKTNVSQELVLSEQTLANGNAAPSPMKAPKRGRPRERARSQEMPSSPRIIDENTAPTSESPKRKRSRVNLPEAPVDFEPSKPHIPEETSRRNVDKTSMTDVDEVRPAEFDMKIAKDRSDDLPNLPIKRGRGRPVGSGKIRRTRRVRLSTVSAKSNRDEVESSRESGMSTTKDRRDATSSVILAVPPLDAFKDIPDVGKDDESSLPEESAREVTSEPRISARRVRSEKNPEVDTAIAARDSSSGKICHGNADSSAKLESTLEETTEELVGPVTNRRRGRSGKILEIRSLPLTTRRRGRRVVSSGTRLDTRQSELSQQRSTTIESGKPANRRKWGHSRRKSKRKIRAARKTFDDVPTEKSSQDPEKLPEKIIERDIESSLLVPDTPDDSRPLSPRLVPIEPQERTPEGRIVPEENVEATISLMPDREATPEESSSMRKIAENYRKGTAKNVLPSKRRPTYRWRRKRRWSRKPWPFSKQFAQAGSTEEESTAGTTKECSDGSDSSLTKLILDENMDLNTARVTLCRKRTGKVPCTAVSTVTFAEPIAKEKADQAAEPTTRPDGSAIARKRVRFEEESNCASRSAKGRQDSSPETSEARPKRLYKKIESNSPGPARDIVEEACEKSSDDSSVSGDAELSSLNSLPLSERLKALRNERRYDRADEAKSTETKERNGSACSRRNELPSDYSLRNTRARVRFQRKRSREVLRERVSPGSKSSAIRDDDEPGFSRIGFSKSSDLPFELRNLRISDSSRFSPRETIACARSKSPIILLKRLSLKTLKRYGIAYRPRDRTFVKLSEKSVRRYNTEDEEDDEDEEVPLPAYDGAADLSSSDEDDPDVTIAREEKRVCSYGTSVKKSSLAKRDESAVTPKKRKLEVAEEASSPAKKLTADVTRPRDNVTPRKKSYRSSTGGTSTLKTPGGGKARIYSPLKIIVTSPKVRKETLETKSSPRRTEIRDGNANDASTSSFTDSLATTSTRKNSRLHDNVLRGRLLNTAKSSLRELGDKHVTVDKTGSSAVGELDEIRCIGQTEQRTVSKLRTSIASECHESSGLRDPPSSTTLPDGKDVRKRLLFSDNDTNHGIEKITDLPIPELNETPEITEISSKDIERLGEIEDDEGSIDVAKSPKHREAMMFEIVPGSSRCRDDFERIREDGTKVHTDDEDVDDDDDDDNNVCNVTFTQYIESQKNKNETSFSADYETNEMKERITIMPKFKPPSRQRIVDTMEKYGIAKYRNEEPFFSVAADVPRRKELAHKMLRVPGKSLDFLPAYVPTVEGVTGLARWRKMWLNEFHPSLAKTKEQTVRFALASSSERIVVTPLVRPPTYKQVENWLRAREYLAKKKSADVEESKKKSKPPDVEGSNRASKRADVEESGMKLNQSELSEVRAVENDKDDGVSDSSDVSVVEPSPERTLVSKDHKKMTRSATSAEFAKRTLFKVKPGDCKNSDKNGPSSRESRSSREKMSSDSNALPDPSLLDVLEKSRLFRDQESSRHLGVSRGQIEFLSASTRSNVTAENLRNVKALTRYQYLTIMCLEVHVVTRGDLLPDAQHDPIAAIFYSVQSDVPPTSSIKALEHGVIVLAEDERSKNKMHYAYASRIPWTVNFASNEEVLLDSLVTLITRTDPEILIGWELETLSWGYVFQRASRLGINLFKRVSRIPATQYKWECQAPDIETLAEVKLPGRIVLDVWRIMRHEAALLSYTFESVIHHVLNERIPCPSYATLTDWWNLGRARPCRWRVVEHYGTRVLGVFRILDQLDIIGRTSELARLFGIQFYEVFSRGSQFRVESVMLRLAKPLNYIAVSPSPQQRASMRAMEALPLIMEPESMLYSDPLIVLDFQSLYPSIIIAHNYCFSTCLGRIEHIGQPEPFEFGAYTLRVPKRTALKLQGKVNYAPCGVAYAKPEVRLGILPRMLTEILETRFMVKKAMKDHDKEDKTLQRALHSRQMGLKFLANVTYGYTAANFSGRMPCIEVGDSVISKSKETLERAIKLVESTPKWGARVVYGDTDSLFILVPGKSKDEAFVIGNEIADAVTASNPPPIKLKFEKILFPAILQTKKRYCGYMYETPEQVKPTYLAKGIETVRRDGCPAVSKILEKTLKILFETKDVSLVKKYVTRQLDKVLRGKVSIQDLTFAKEFRGLKGYKAKACVPALELTRRLTRKDPRAVPRTGERVRYVIIAGAPNQALIHCVRTPWELINDPGLRPNAIYYVTRVIIPPLNRCLNLMGVDVKDWYREMPHRQVLDNPVGQPSDKQKLTIFQYFGTIVCVACGQSSNKGICVKCLGRPADTLVAINEKLRWLDRTDSHVTAICQSCVGQADAADCASLDCPVLYRRAQARRELTQATHLREIIKCGNNLEF